MQPLDAKPGFLNKPRLNQRFPALGSRRNAVPRENNRSTIKIVVTSRQVKRKKRILQKFVTDRPSPKPQVRSWEGPNSISDHQYFHDVPDRSHAQMQCADHLRHSRDRPGTRSARIAGRFIHRQNAPLKNSAADACPAPPDTANPYSNV
jgi:hypothetical protein